MMLVSILGDRLQGLKSSEEDFGVLSAEASGWQSGLVILVLGLQCMLRHPQESRKC